MFCKVTKKNDAAKAKHMNIVLRLHFCTLIMPFSRL